MERRRGELAEPALLRTTAVWKEVAAWVYPAALLLIVAATAVVRTRDLDALGLSSDEAVYLGQGRAIGDGAWPQVRAHPPLLGALLRLVPHGTTGEAVPRTIMVIVGLGAVVLAGLLAQEVAGRAAGVLAACVVAVTPYHADVTRLVLVEVPMATAVALATLLVVRAQRLGQPALVDAAAVALGVATLFKETAILSALALAVAVFAGVVLLPLRAGVRAAAWFVTVTAAYPVYLLGTGGLPTAIEYVRWQFARVPSGGSSYVEEVLPRLGWGLVLVAAVGAVAVVARRHRGGVVVVISVLVPALFYALWPVASYPYPLVLVAPLGALAGCGGVWLARAVAPARARHTAPGIAAGASLLVLLGAMPAYGDAPVLPGASGAPAVREVAVELERRPELPVVAGAPWVVNILRHYLPSRRISTLSAAGADPTLLNPSYRSGSSKTLPEGPIAVVWDAWSATSDPAGTARLVSQTRARGGRMAHVEIDPSSHVPRPLVVVFIIDSSVGQVGSRP